MANEGKDMKRETKSKGQLDIYKIKTAIRKKHEDFMERVGFAADYVVAEHSLKMAVMHARITAILHCLMEEGIITKFEVKDLDYSQTFVLSKSGAVNRVFVIICPFVRTGIVLRTSSPNIEIGRASDVQKAIGQDDDVPGGYRWEDVATEILELVHAHIYERKAALEVSLFDDWR